MIFLYAFPSHATSFATRRRVTAAPAEKLQELLCSIQYLILGDASFLTLKGYSVFQAGFRLDNKDVLFLSAKITLVKKFQETHKQSFAFRYKTELCWIGTIKFTISRITDQNVSCIWQKTIRGCQITGKTES